MLLPLLATLVPATLAVPAQEPDSTDLVRVFETTQLSTDFYCEGAAFGDFNGDGDADVAAGPFWYEGPGFRVRHRIYEVDAFDIAGYSDNFFGWARDFDGDGLLDLFVIGFPGQQSWWFQNPGDGDALWPRHLVHDNVDNESPWFTDLNGDGLEDLVCSSGGILCWFERDASDPTARWTRHDISADLKLGRFTHGMGVGDVNGDGRADLLLNTGWWEQPESLEGDPHWQHHAYLFSTGQGGAQMLVQDVDGDGDSDVISSLNAHKYGLSWFEQVPGADGAIDFVAHPIMGLRPGQHGCPLAVSELHALDTADVNGDGLLDVITGKRWHSHGRSEKGADDPAYLLWFELGRGESGVTYTPHVIHDDSGVGTQVMAGDIDGDGRIDVVVGNKRGAFVHLQRSVPAGDAPAPIPIPAPEEAEEPARPAPFPAGGEAPVGEDGHTLNLDFETGTLEDWTAEGAAFDGQPTRGDAVFERRGDSHSDHAGRFWIGGFEVSGDGPQGSLTSAPFVITQPFAAFMIAGGVHSGTRVDIKLVDGDRAIASAVGRNAEALRPTVVDLSEHVGQQVYLRLVDEHSGGWGHLNFDHFRLYAERPVFADGLEVEATLDVAPNAGLTPEESAAAMTVPEGFRVDLIAGEPDVYQPIAFTIDERGRLWVAEAHSYPIKRKPEDATDKIVIFEDSDGDGSFETRKVFAEGLNLVSGMEVGFGGVFIGAAPELLFIPDADHDDVPDGPPQVLLDGWAFQDTHETLNAFIWGPDGWLYGCHGVFTHSRVGAPGTPDDERVAINAGVWRYHPQSRDFEVFAYGSSNPWGVDFDDHGQALITACVIPHLFHTVQGGRYERQAGRHFNEHIYADIPTIADHLHWTGSDPWAGNGRSDGAGGGHAHCGAMIYLGDSWPERYRNTLFVNNIHGNRVNNEVLVPDRSGLIGLHGDDFLLANDQWYRGINLHYGPDGSVYLIDWYDEQACHLRDPEIWDRSNGRIFRVVYGDQQPVKADLLSMDEEELVELQLHPNDWYVRSARRLLQERGISATGARRLEAIALEHDEVPRRLRALWALHCGGALQPELLFDLAHDDDPHMRAWAVQLACENGAPERRFVAAMERMAASDDSPVVRLYLASALQRLPLKYRWRIAQGLVAHAEDADDPNIPYLVWYGIEPLVPADPLAAMQLGRGCRIPLVKAWIYRRAASDDVGREALLTVLGEVRDDASRTQILDQALAALGERRAIDMPATWSTTYERLTARADDAVLDRAVALAAIFGDVRVHPQLRERLADSGAPLDQRRRALDALVRGRDQETVPILCALLEENDLRADALKALAGFNHPDVPRAILSSYSSFDETQRRDAVSTLTSRAVSALALLDAIEEGAVDRTQLTAFELRKLRQLGDEQVNTRLTAVWGVAREVGADKQAEIERWKTTLTDERLAAADLSQGRDVYARTCMRCHKLYGQGEEIGPDITGSNRSDLDYLLQNVIDPNAIIPNEYQVTMILTEDGRIVTGILQAENEDAVTLRTENEFLTLGRDEIDVMKADANSMMPQDQMLTITEEEVAALMAYLRHDAQVPRRLTAENLADFFDGESLKGWIGDTNLWSVEQGEIVGDSPGIDHNSFLVSDHDLGDFRLVVEVKLTPNNGNSGIQLRSTRHADGVVAGYQADMGAGWWGKLYDEHGRGLLVGDDRDEHVLVDGWNTYEILAVGPRIQTALNGHPCVDFTDPNPVLRGFLALQIHSGGEQEVRFRNLQLDLDPEPVLSSVLAEGQ